MESHPKDANAYYFYALAAGRYEAPPGRNALDLFAAVLLARPDHPEARAGLGETATRLMALATSKAQAGEEDEARRLVERVLAVDAGHAAVRGGKSRDKNARPRLRSNGAGSSTVGGTSQLGGGPVRHRGRAFIRIATSSRLRAT
jgi:hypothetical protein